MLSLLRSSWSRTPTSTSTDSRSSEFEAARATESVKAVADTDAPTPPRTTSRLPFHSPPATSITDDELLRIGSQYGEIISHKAIINSETGLCE